MDTQGGVEGGGGGRERSRRTSQEVTSAMPDYKQCALSTSAVLAMEHTTSVSTKGVALIRGGKHGLNLLCVLLPFNGTQWEQVGGIWARKALH